FYDENIIYDNNFSVNSLPEEPSASSIFPGLHELYDIYDEANFISNIAIKSSFENKKIIIITGNYFLHDLVTSRLSSCGVSFCSSLGKDYTHLAETSLFQLLVRMKYEKGSKESFLAFLSSNIINQNESIKIFLEKLNNDKKLYNDIESIYHDNIEFIQELKLNNLINILRELIENKIYLLCERLEDIYNSFKKIYCLLELKTIYSNSERFRNFVENLITLDQLNYYINDHDFAIYVQNIFTLKSTMPFDKNARIFLLKYDDSLLIDADKVIFADFNHESIIKNEAEDNWLSQNIFNKILGVSSKANYHKILYQVSCKISNTYINDHIIFSRSMFKESVRQEKCPVLDLIRHQIVPYRSLKEGFTNLETKFIADKSSISKAFCEDLPRKLYATNIELLIRNPYGFFAKKVLGLNKKNNLLSRVEASDFGSIIHKYIENISLYPNKSLSEIFSEICNSLCLPQFYFDLWKMPALNIGEEIQKMNNLVEQGGSNYFTEIEGSISYEILPNNFIELRAIADRIEISNDKIRIIDYKTGAPPTKADVLIGKSPQLMIEAIIYYYNGFKPNIIFNEDRNIELVFYKVNTKSPFLEEKIIVVSIEEIKLHNNSLRELLECYYKEEFSYFNSQNILNTWAPKYNDYGHFARNSIIL
ncbi:MAG: PD-(D/E)XK nuclease family protein, partial [Rickettsiaceae bacterium]|nr:PD-(D/E)XK nuclease family protein [Rickettsiaceae bacterium]